MNKKHQIINGLREYLLPERCERLYQVIQNRTRYIHVAVEDTESERNAGALFRTCDCFGIQEASVIEQKYDLRVAKMISKGAEKWLDIRQYQGARNMGVADCVHDLKSRGFTIVATTPHEPDIELPDFELQGKTAFFFGTEETGLSDEAIELADIKMGIPIYGFAESYNISVSAALILQNAVAQMRRKGLDWEMSEEEKLDLEIEWLKKALGRGSRAIYEKVISEIEE